MERKIKIASIVFAVYLYFFSAIFHPNCHKQEFYRGNGEKLSSSSIVIDVDLRDFSEQYITQHIINGLIL